MAMASSTFITSTSKLKLYSATPTLTPIPSKTKLITSSSTPISRRQVAITALTGLILSPALFSPATPPANASDEDYVKETEEVIKKVRSTITLDRNDPNVAEAVARLREASNTWVAKYRKEKDLLARVSFRDTYSALNAVSGHYGSFGTAAPLPAKRRTRILEEMDTAEKALLKGR